MKKMLLTLALILLGTAVSRVSAQYSIEIEDFYGLVSYEKVSCTINEWGDFAFTIKFSGDYTMDFAGETLNGDLYYPEGHGELPIQKARIPIYIYEIASAPGSACQPEMVGYLYVTEYDNGTVTSVNTGTYYPPYDDDYTNPDGTWQTRCLFRIRIGDPSPW